MTPEKFYSTLTKKFPHTPTPGQDEALRKLSEFALSRERDEVFLMTGYAGTGKTSIISALSGALKQHHRKLVMLAPTGRAAKVISGYTGADACTIHKKIYHPQSDKNGAVSFTLRENLHTNTIFVVDEASMVPDINSQSKLFDNGALLDDLMFYVYSGENCKLVLVGDTAQLPPVKLEVSPALDEELLATHYKKNIIAVALDEVVRQQRDSGILANATTIRECLRTGDFKNLKLNLNGFDDIVRPFDSDELNDAVNDAYARHGKEGTVVILRSNKRANLYNKSIRTKIFDREDRISPGDFMMVVKNNYFWLEPESEAGFIANGDVIEVLRIHDFEKKYGFSFARAEIRMADYPNMKPFEVMLLLDTIESNTPSLTHEDNTRLYQEAQKEHAKEKSGYKRFKNLRKDKYLNALQVKFSYAVTCHKSQGGQWYTVFVEQPWLPDGPDRDYLRWLYTAVTRAREKLYLIGFKDNFFDE